MGGPVAAVIITSGAIAAFKLLKKFGGIELYADPNVMGTAGGNIRVRRSPKASGVEAAKGAADAVRLKSFLRASEQASPLWDSLRAQGTLPSNFITKLQARALGWTEGKSVTDFLGDKRIGGDLYHNRTGLLPSAQGRVWREADLSLAQTGKRGADRFVYSNDGLAYITSDHYASFQPYPGGVWK